METIKIYGEESQIISAFKSLSHPNTNATIACTQNGKHCILITDNTHLAKQFKSQFDSTDLTESDLLKVFCDQEVISMAGNGSSLRFINSIRIGF
ncbi:hypothetical protein [Ekhidna sp.]|uniref:hypothetical protein n=1 Tax=Ekhidna sp. TaxID=2608089 RepID=UPI003297D1CA